MERNRQPIGVFDSGVGGLTVVNKLRMLLPHENIIYVGDTKRNPYGSRTPEEIFSYTRDILRFMSEKRGQARRYRLQYRNGRGLRDGAERSAVSPHRHEPRHSYGPGNQRQEKNRRLRDGFDDCQSQPLKKMAAAIDPDIEIVEQACPALANLVERGVLSGEEIMEPLRRYTAPVIASGADTANFWLHAFSLCAAFIRRAVRRYDCLCRPGSRNGLADAGSIKEGRPSQSRPPAGISAPLLYRRGPARRQAGRTSHSGQRIYS